MTKEERIFKGKNKILTLSVKIYVDDPELPEYIYVGFQRFRVSVFAGDPWQCYKCRGFGDIAAHCRFRPRCLLCAGLHELPECDRKKDNARLTSEVCCPNCKGKHTANYGGCPNYKMANKVEQIRVTNKISYRDAVKMQKDIKG